MYQYLIDGNIKYGTKEKDICKSVIGCDKNIIKENVIIAPWWEPDKYDTSVQVEMIVDGPIKVWEFSIEDKNYTYIKTGIGASVCTDVILALGCTKCKNIIFVGSVGSLIEGINIGDIVIPRFSICGDGVCKYLSKNIDVNCFGERNYPDGNMFTKVTDVTDKICIANKVKWHIADNFSVDTIFAQFAHLDNIISMGAQVIEMETSASFKAANISGISICAIFIVSDNSTLKKSLYSGRTEEEQLYRSEVRRKIIPQIIYQVF
ncbi:phosphorylase [Clostridium lacusfryxellense]|nr:phosphorylase [Clostridium lacusfryxellense]